MLTVTNMSSTQSNGKGNGIFVLVHNCSYFDLFFGYVLKTCLCFSCTRKCSVRVKKKRSVSGDLKECPVVRFICVNYVLCSRYARVYVCVCVCVCVCACVRECVSA